MNKIIPFNKDIAFAKEIGEITSIALDDTLKFDDDYTIKGDLIVRGCHKVNDIEEDFSYTLPALITVDKKYDTTSATISVDDFYYEIVSNDTLKVKIDLILDNLYYKEEEKEEPVEIIQEELKEERDDKKIDMNKDKSLSIDANLKKNDLDINFDLEKKNIENISVKPKEEKVDVTDLFKPDDTVDYSIYRVYMVRDDDTLDAILDKYKVSKEELEKYNDLSSIKRGDKLIIPSVDE